MSWVRRAVSAVATGTTALTITKPTGTVDGDIMVMFLTHKGAGYATMPAGWTVIEQEISGSTRGEAHWKRASGEGANYAIADLADSACGHIISYIGGLASGDVISASTARANASGAKGTGNLVIPDSNTLILGAACAGGNLAIGSWTIGYSGITDTRSMLEVADNGTANGSDSRSASAELIQSQPTTVTFTWTQTNVENVGILVALKEEPGLGAGDTITQFYLTRRPHGVVIPGPVRGPWDEDTSGSRLHSLVVPAYLLSRTKIEGGPQTTFTEGETNDTANWDFLLYRGVTNKLTAQTISGTLDVLAMVHRSDLASSVYWKVYAYIAIGDTGAVRHVLLDYTDTAGTAWTVTPTQRALAAAQTLASGDTVAGDRVIIEIGCRFASNSAVEAFNTAVTMRVGTLSATGLVPLADASAGSTTVAAPYVTFSVGLTEQADAAAPANDACADAVTLGPSLPATHSVDSSGSTDFDHAVWYTWVADFDGPVFLDTFGGLPDLTVSVYTGGCGALALVGSNSNGNWIQRSQSVRRWVAVNGTTYHIRVKGDGVHSHGYVQVRLWKYVAPQIGDLFVNCQHIVVYREGVPVNIQSGFYGLTPTGSSVDYSLRAMDDLNGGTHSLPRLYVCLFGDAGLVEILDLATLNVGENEIDFIADAIDDGDENLASSIFDRDGNLLLGWFGDNYDHLGIPASAGTFRIRKGDARHADLQTGAPWPLFTPYTVDQENGGSDYIELAADQDTIYYTSAGQTIFRYSLATGQLSVFATVPVAPGPRPGLRGLRLLPPGDGSGGLLVCNGSRVERLNAAGAVIQSYTPGATDRAKDLDKVELTTDGDLFWVSDQLSTSMFKFNVATGAELEDIETNLPSGQLCGFSVYNGYRAGLEEEPPPGEEEEEVCVTAPPTAACWNPETPSAACANPHAGPPSGGCWNAHSIDALQVGLSDS